MIKQTVNSENGGNEGRWILFLVCLILLCAAFFLPYHQLEKAPSTLQPYQIAVTDINSKEIAMIAELRLAHEEIRNLYADSQLAENNATWALPSDLEALWIPPFTKDKSWEQHGKHHWQQIAPAVYQGIPALETGSSALILLSFSHNPDIWINLSAQSHVFKVQQSEFSIQQLITAGWSQIVFPDSNPSLAQPLHN